MEEQLVDVPVAQQASPPRVELPIPVEISSSLPSAETMNSPEMNLPIHPESSSPPRAQSPVDHAETTIPQRWTQLLFSQKPMSYQRLHQHPLTWKLQLYLEHLLLM
jgi:hypothetical protein